MLRRMAFLLAVFYFYLTTHATLAERIVGSTIPLTVLTMNVGGLPANLDPSGPSDDDKIRYTMYMGMVMTLNNYDVINIQEDFKYHETLYQYDKHLFRTKTSGCTRSGSGLNTLSKYSWTGLSRIEWDSCNKPCIAQKGFTFMRVRVHEGAYIDMINIDTNAGTKSSDQAARRSNIQQVAKFIDTHSIGNAVIVFGNTNSLYTRAKDNIRLFITQNNLTDAWVQATGGRIPAIGKDPIVCPNGVPPTIKCEVGDKIFYRGSPVINITSVGFYYDTSRFLAPEGKTLTKYNPVRVEFRWNLKFGLQQSDLYGGPFGQVYTWFNDLPSLPPSPKLSSITLRGGSRLDGLTLTLASGQKFTHGGPGGHPSTLTLDQGEYVTSVKVCWGEKHGHTRNFFAQVTTNKAKIIQAGKMTKDCSTATAPKGYGVVGTYGQDGRETDQLGFIYALQ